MVKIILRKTENQSSKYIKQLHQQTSISTSRQINNFEVMKISV